MSNESIANSINLVKNTNLTGIFQTSNNPTEESDWSFWGPHSTNVSRGGAVIVGETNTDDASLSTNDAAWVLTATFIIFTMQSGDYHHLTFLLL